MWKPVHGRRRPTVVALLAVLVLLAPASASAQPGDEGSTPTLAQVLESANRGYVDAQQALDASRKRQAELTRQADEVEGRLAVKTREAASIASTAYRTGRLTSAAAMLDGGAADTLLDRATTLQSVAARNDRKLRELTMLRRELSAARAKVEAEVTLQQQQVDAMSKQKQEAERALAAAGGRATGGFVSATSPLAQPAPRKADGTWPKESCIIDDPTPASGCITPRTLHALQQSKAAGFTRFVSCYRPGGPYEHPKGRACDFSSEVGGFGGVASGGDRLYGNNLAAFLVRNADRLGVLYVIWFKQIWTPAAGWHSYGAGYGDPSSDHTNHIHLSVY